MLQKNKPRYPGLWSCGILEENWWIRKVWDWNVVAANMDLLTGVSGM